MDLNRLTRDADDLIRKVVSRYNQLYMPAGSISQVELDLILDEIRKLYDTFKTIGHVSLSLQQNPEKQKVTVQAQPAAGNQANSDQTLVHTSIPAEKSIPEQQPPMHSAGKHNQEPSTDIKTEASTSLPQELQHEEDLKPIDEFKEENIPENSMEVVCAEIKTDIPVENNEVSESSISNEKLVDKSDPDDTNTGQAPAMLADRFSVTSKSLSESISATPVKDVVGGRLLFQPIADLTTGIGLNDKFNFVNELFGNNPIHYDEAIVRINKAVNLDEANWILQKYHSSEWDQKQETITRLKEFIKRRFI